MKNKTKSDYILIINYTITEIHTDFETVIGDDCIQIFPNSKILYCI